VDFARRLAYRQPILVNLALPSSTWCRACRWMPAKRKERPEGRSFRPWSGRL